MRPTSCFYRRSPGRESIMNINRTSGLNGVSTRSTLSNASKVRETTHLFKVPKFDSIPVKAGLKSVLSPTRKVHTGRVTDIGKFNQCSKMNFPHSSFMNSALHHSRRNLVNTKRELIKKMIYMAECSLKESKEPKHSTPVKLPVGVVTPRTPRLDGYSFSVPDLKKKTPKQSGLGTPIQNIIKGSKLALPSLQLTPYEKKKPVCNSGMKLNFSFESKEVVSDSLSVPNDKATFNSILNHCQSYNSKVHDVYQKLKKLELCFTNNIKNLPDYEVYDEFCRYQAKKNELYGEIKVLEEELDSAVKIQVNVGNKLKEYVKQREEIFDKRLKLHKGFEEVIQKALEKCEGNKENKKTAVESIKIEEQKPKLRRSLRLSRIPKKLDEKTPMSKKLKKLDTKSKRIQKDSSIKTAGSKRY